MPPDAPAPPTDASALDLRTVREELDQLRGKKVFFQRLPGSNGDLLHEYGSEFALERAGTALVQTPAEADAVVFDGSAAVSSEWQVGLDLLRDRLVDTPDRPIWVLPSTYGVDDVDLAAMIGDRAAPLYLFCRERGSLDMLGRQTLPPCVKLGLDHDMAFHLEESPLVQRLKGQLAERHILVVERNDIESPTGERPVAPMPGPDLIKRLVPNSLSGPVKRMILRRKHLQKDVGRPFVKEAVSRVHKAFPETRGLPVLPWDVSRVDISSFDHFTKTIAHSAVIVTTRLHVGILGSMLGKRVFVRFGSALPHKFRGIFELSLSKRPGVEVL